MGILHEIGADLGINSEWSRAEFLVHGKDVLNERRLITILMDNAVTTLCETDDPVERKRVWTRSPAVPLDHVIVRISKFRSNGATVFLKLRDTTTIFSCCLEGALELYLHWKASLSQPNCLIRNSDQISLCMLTDGKTIDQSGGVLLIAGSEINRGADAIISVSIENEIAAVITRAKMSSRVNDTIHDTSFKLTDMAENSEKLQSHMTYASYQCEVLPPLSITTFDIISYFFEKALDLTKIRTKGLGGLLRKAASIWSHGKPNRSLLSDTIWSDALENNALGATDKLASSQSQHKGGLFISRRK